MRCSVQLDAVDGFASEEQVGARAELNQACGLGCGGRRCIREAFSGLETDAVPVQCLNVW
jgi:hypothetical protein